MICNFCLSVAAHQNCLSRSVPEIHWHVAGSLSNQETNTQSLPSGQPVRGAWQGSHWSTMCGVTGMTRPEQSPTAKAGFEPRFSALGARSLPPGQRGGRGGGVGIGRGFVCWLVGCLTSQRLPKRLLMRKVCWWASGCLSPSAAIE